MPEKNPNLQYYLVNKKTVADLITPDSYTIPEAEQERHRIFSGLLMALVCHYWNGLKKGRDGTYPLNPKVNEKLKYGQNDYVGHNIAAIAVNDRGQVIDFEFNHNVIFNSSAEHAEARLIRRIYGLSQVMDAYSDTLGPIKGLNDYDTFQDVTVYTSLESCSQCSGVMALARVKQVVYLQLDPGMYSIGHIIRNLTKKIQGVSEGKLEAQRPVDGDAIGFARSAELDNAFSAFVALMKEKKTPFFDPVDPQATKDFSASITSFLCTEAAYRIYHQALNDFFNLSAVGLAHPGFVPEQSPGVPVAHALSNGQALKRAQRFFIYATQAGRRGTPHP